jgi:hypothetical protein
LISRILFLVFLTSILLSAGIFSTVNAQLPGPNNGSNSQDKSISTIIPKKSIGLRIDSPLKGDQIFINGVNYLNKNGEKLSIHGTSTSDTSGSSTCGVSIIANSVKPYQSANGTGPKGKTDYSSWIYNFSPSYAALKEGSNKITSKLSCQPGNLVAYYSVNVTGVKSTGTFPSAVGKPLVGQSTLSNNSTTSPQPSLSTNTKNLSSAPLSQSTLPLYPSSPSSNSSLSFTPNNSTPFTPNNSTAPPLPSLSTNTKNLSSAPLSQSTLPLYPSSPSSNSSPSFTPNNSTAPPLPSLSTNTKNLSSAPISQSNSSAPVEPNSMNITIDKKESGRTQALVITVKDSITDKPIDGVNLIGKINDVTFSGITNSNGKFSKAIPSSVIKSSSTIDVAVTASADGYKSNKANTSFDISSRSSSISATGTNTKSKSGANDMAAKIAKDVQSQLSKQGINIPLPFG